MKQFIDFGKHSVGVVLVKSRGVHKTRVVLGDVTAVRAGRAPGGLCDAPGSSTCTPICSCTDLQIPPVALLVNSRRER